jgi:hypothetical protein
MKKGAYKKEYIFAVQKKNNDIQRGKENNRGCARITSDVADSKDGKTTRVVKPHN